ncbi:MAG: RNA-binding protein [Acaryochloris sp. RU_4_1]|nr:RNA-binding protein [Acaryochloris sp. RU_4_1]NJR53430.1 RNA-binding protein [Acaryochloris sp. CRU_2_0]
MSNPHIQRGEEWLMRLLGHLGMTTQVLSDKPEIVRTQFKDFGGFWLTINDQSLSQDQLDVLVGDQGQMLDAIQYLINSTLNLGKDRADRTAYTIELSGFRITRYGEVAELAAQAAQRVRQTGQDYEMPPLSSAERRLVHTLLFEEADLETFSRGQEPDRRLVVTQAAADRVQEDADE